MGGVKVMSGVWYVGGVRDEWSVVCGWGER